MHAVDMWRNSSWQPIDHILIFSQPKSYTFSMGWYLAFFRMTAGVMCKWKMSAKIGFR